MKTKYTAYAFPGGYPKFYFTERNQVVCADCANKEEEGVKLTPAINYDSAITCDDCNEKIESAYGED